MTLDSFGLLGVVTSITFKLPRLTYANLKPVGIPLILAIPPPDDSYVPEAVRRQMQEFNITDEMRARAMDNFITRSGDFYSEWFWFIMQPTAWVNTWNNDGDASKSKDYRDQPTPRLNSLKPTS